MRAQAPHWATGNDDEFSDGSCILWQTPCASTACIVVYARDCCQTKMQITGKSRAEVMAERIDGRSVRSFTLRVTSLKPLKERAGWFHIEVGVADRQGTVYGPLMTGIVSGGGRGVQPWFECRIYPRVDAPQSKPLDARSKGLEKAIIDVIGEIVPPAGHLMIDYEAPGQEETFAELNLRVPPPASYLGSLMFRAGFQGQFKDWYFSEGGHEGPRKLQANKSPDAAAARRARKAHRQELTAFLQRPLPDRPDQAAIIRRARERARELLREMRGKALDRSG
jgi:hypothetical protein